MGLKIQDLVAYFNAGAKPKREWRIGTEYEKFLVQTENNLPIPYDGNAGMGAILSGLASHRGWREVREGAFVIGLVKDGASISLEPGGQFELSGAPYASLAGTIAELSNHLDDLQWVQEKFPEVGALWKGFHPTARQEDVSWMPKGRYGIMREYLPKKGELGTTMMKRTCTVQANLDYRSEEDAAQKLRVASVVSPIVTAMFANSSEVEGQESGWASYRQHVWSDVDGDRCGNPSCFLGKDRTKVFACYTEWALDVPLFFVYRQGTYGEPPGLTFREWMEQGIDGLYPKISDWELHLSTLFPNVRLKKYIEVRSADCVEPELIPALPTLWRGLLYSDSAMGQIDEEMGDMSATELAELYRDACKHGLEGDWKGRSIRKHAHWLLDVAESGINDACVNEQDIEMALSFLKKLRTRISQ